MRGFALVFALARKPPHTRESCLSLFVVDFVRFAMATREVERKSSKPTFTQEGGSGAAGSTQPVVPTPTTQASTTEEGLSPFLTVLVTPKLTFSLPRQPDWKVPEDIGQDEVIARPLRPLRTSSAPLTPPSLHALSTVFRACRSCVRPSSRASPCASKWARSTSNTSLGFAQLHCSPFRDCLKPNFPNLIFS